MTSNSLDPHRPKRPAVKWHGGKWRLAKWIISHFPEHDAYIEPFGGSAAVLLQKERSLIEVYNDLDKDVYNFFEVLRTRPDLLIHQIKYTPFHYEEYSQSFDPTDDPLENARRFYARAYLSIMGPTIQWSNGFRRQKVYSRGRSGNNSMKPAAHSFAEIEHLWVVADRLRGIVFESMDALQLIELYAKPNTLFYVDPPYLGSTRGHSKDQAYKHEMLDEESHDRLLNLLLSLTAPKDTSVSKSPQRAPKDPPKFILSGYDNPLYNKLLSHGWTKVHKNARTNGQNSRSETLWMSH